MTICIGLSFSDYALVCADTRQLFVHPDGRRAYDDGPPRVRASKAGLIAASGLGNLTDAVMARVRDMPEHAAAAARIVEVIDQERATACARLRERAVPAAEIESWLAGTAWLVTSRALGDGEPKIRLAVDDPSRTRPEGRLVPIAPDTFHVAMPVGANGEQRRAFESVLHENMKPQAAFATFEEHFTYHTTLCVELIRGAATLFDDVAAAMHLGLHTPTRCEVTDRIALPSPPDEPPIRA